MKFEDLKELGSEVAAKAGGKYRQEGKNYTVEGEWGQPGELCRVTRASTHSASGLVLRWRCACPGALLAAFDECQHAWVTLDLHAAPQGLRPTPGFAVWDLVIADAWVCCCS